MSLRAIALVLSLTWSTGSFAMQTEAPGFSARARVARVCGDCRCTRTLGAGPLAASMIMFLALGNMGSASTDLHRALDGANITLANSTLLHPVDEISSRVESKIDRYFSGVAVNQVVNALTAAGMAFLVFVTRDDREVEMDRLERTIFYAITGTNIVTACVSLVYAAVSNHDVIHDLDNRLTIAELPDPIPREWNLFSRAVVGFEVMTFLNLAATVVGSFVVFRIVHGAKQRPVVERS